MNTLRTFFWAIFALAFLTGNSWADLKSPAYTSAKFAYERGEWTRAHDLLIKYKVKDQEFLAANPGVSGNIDLAISFCIEEIDWAKSGNKKEVSAPPIPLPSPPRIKPGASMSANGIQMCGCWGPKEPHFVAALKCGSDQVRVGTCE